MPGNFIYDIVTVVGLIIFVFMITYWAAVYGVDVLSKLVLSSPGLIQDSAASFLSSSCSTENYTVTLNQKSTIPFEVALTKDVLLLQPPKQSRRDWTNIEEGGYVKFRTLTPSNLVRCKSIFTIEGNKTFETKNKKIIISKLANNISARVE